MLLGKLSIPVFVVAWDISANTVKRSLLEPSGDAVVTPASLNAILREVATTSAYMSRSISMIVSDVREATTTEKQLFEHMSHRHATGASVVQALRGSGDDEEMSPDAFVAGLRRGVTRGRSCLVSRRNSILRHLNMMLDTTTTLADLFTPCIAEITFRLRPNVARGEIPLQQYEEASFAKLLELLLTPDQTARLNVTQRNIQDTFRHPMANYHFTASRFMGCIEHASLHRTAEAPQPAGLTIQMRPYQRKTLHFCLQRETSTTPTVAWEPIYRFEDRVLYYGPALRRFWTGTGDARPPSVVRGGILADEMGMGKTLEALALVLSNPAPDGWEGAKTLVVRPVSLVSQWVAEARKCLEDPGLIYVHHGSRRHKNVEFLNTCNLVVTTYGIVTRDECLRTAHWHRVVMDESHVVRRPSTQRFLACNDLKSQHVWCVTGTPLVNGNVSELYWQMRLVMPSLRICGNMMSWNHRGFVHLLSKCMTRHTKSMRVNGTPILELPDMRIENVELELGESSLAQYKRMASNFAQVCRSTTMARIMVIINRLRRRCSSGVACEQLLSASMSAGAFMTPEEQRHARTQMAESSCAICLEPIALCALVRPCNHVFCDACITTHIHRALHVSCPLCRGPLRQSSLRYFPPPEEEQDTPEVQDRYDVKMDRVVREIVSATAGDKFVIFSNFKSTLNRIEQALGDAGVETRRYGGSKSIAQRHRTMCEFSTDNTARVLLLPLRSTAVGLNITAANRVLFMEPCMSSALEAQAIGRCWRMGQTRAVRVQRFILNNTIESRIVEGNATMDRTVRAAAGSERLLQGDRDRVRWGFHRVQWLLRPGEAQSQGLRV